MPFIFNEIGLETDTNNADLDFKEIGYDETSNRLDLRRNYGGKKFDVFVIGSGIAGQTVATNCAKAGLKVAVADKREFGGTCANRGCDPKKVLLAATEYWNLPPDGRKGSKRKTGNQLEKLQKFKNNFTEAEPKSTEEKLKDLGITLYHQSPQFLDKNTLEVEGKKVQAKKIVIATGYEPRVLPIKGISC
ncbi:FAD-dependent oxidoreductase [Winogradskyella maritima]|nr:FAD-dependent oxidoreductase [Winogradskyella maritima]